MSNWSKVFQILPKFSVDQVGLYINWANTSLFIILGKLPTLNLPIKSHPSLMQPLFLMEFQCQVIMVAKKRYLINLIPHYLIDIIYKTVKPLHLEKLQIMQNLNRRMFQVIFIFSDRILILWSKLQLSPPLPSWGKQIFLPGVLSGGVGHE